MGLQIIGWMDMEETKGLAVIVYGDIGLSVRNLGFWAGQNNLIFVLDFNTQVLILMYYCIIVKIVSVKSSVHFSKRKKYSGGFR